ncbi:hypothetical protein [Streptomyces sp. NPDC003247]|uniref:hypothetical protein n=1 Tax=Streptomyces sp. NPDC003247 TaxID=3364677 RepID=UPI00368CA33B
MQTPDKKELEEGHRQRGPVRSDEFESVRTPGSQRVAARRATDEDQGNTGFAKILCAMSGVGDGNTTGTTPARRTV